MKTIEEAKAGEVCYFDLHISDEMLINRADIGAYIHHKLKQIRVSSVAVFSITRHIPKDFIGGFVIRYNCIRLAEPDISDLEALFLERSKA
jgi:hypothetical protein